VKIGRPGDDDRIMGTYRRSRPRPKEKHVSQTSGRSLDRVGAVAGIAAVALLVTLIAVLPAQPGPDRPIAEITQSAIDDRSSLLLGSYLGALMAGALLVFGAAVAAVVRRASPDSGWWIVALVGIGGTAAVGIVSNALVVAFVRAVEHGARGESLWIGYSGDHALGTLMAVPLGIFLLGAGLGARASEALPRWLAWVAVAGAAGLLVGAGSITGDELEGGPLAIPLVLGFLALLVWIVATSVVLWRGSWESSPAMEVATAP
jgi:hypothetical protein